MKRITLAELEQIFGKHNERTDIDPYKEPLKAVIVYTGRGWKKPAYEYSLQERSYLTYSNSWGWDWSKLGNRRSGDSLDGADLGIRLDYYNWEVDYCYLVDADTPDEVEEDQ